MFLNTAPVHLVFANRNDTYYGDDLLKLDLNRYLWLELHKNGYDSVFFLSADPESGFVTRSLGDTQGQPFKVSRSIFTRKTTATQFAAWVSKALQDSRCKTALVCSLSDFHAVLSQESWAAALKALVTLEQRKGILVLTASTDAEDSAAILLNSPVFENWQRQSLCREITDMRTATPQGMYEYLSRAMNGRCVFLNACGRERASSLLSHLMLRYPERMEDPETREAMAAFLSRYVSDRQFRAAQGFTGRGIGENPSYKELYQWLTGPNIWQQLKDAALSVPLPAQQVTAAPIFRRKGSVADHLIHISLSDQVQRESPSAVRCLEAIRAEIRSPRNRLENREIKEKIEAILQLHPDPADIASHERKLQTLQFCVDWVHTPDNAPELRRVLELIEQRMTNIDLSRQLFSLKQQWMLNYEHASTKLAQMAITQLEAQIETMETALKHSDDAIIASNMALHLYRVNIDPDSILQEQHLDFLQVPTHAAAAQQPAPEPEPEPEPENIELPEDLEIPSFLYNYTPPSV